MKRNEGIQALRGIAIILIVLSHYNAVLGVFPWASSFGAIGVDIFVVISGFLSYVLSQKFERVSVRKRIEITRYKIKKFYGMHIAMEAFMLILFCVNQCIYGVNWLEIMATAVGIIAAMFLLQSFVPIRKVYYALNGVAWYLSDSVWFYFVAPVVNCWIHNLKNPSKWELIKRIAFLYVTQGILIATTSFLVRGNYKVLHAFFYVSPFFRGIEFVIGSLVGALYKIIKKNSKGLNAKKWTLYEVMSLISLIAICGGINNVKAEFGFIIAIPVACALVLTFALSIGKLSKLVSNLLFIKIGDISFEIFITHFTALSYLEFINQNFAHFGMLPLLVIAFILIFGVALITKKIRQEGARK
jgi:peptidoglycan/LPS O-acetylase OafA/YrhL